MKREGTTNIKEIQGNTGHYFPTKLENLKEWTNF
jgi:hypothetical protein